MEITAMCACGKLTSYAFAICEKCLSKMAESASSASTNKQMAAALLKASVQCSSFQDGARFCDFCGKCISHREFSSKHHTYDCPFRLLGERLNA